MQIMMAVFANTNDFTVGSVHQHNNNASEKNFAAPSGSTQEQRKRENVTGSHPLALRKQRGH
jgi:hypothetical protein